MAGRGGIGEGHRIVSRIGRAVGHRSLAASIRASIANLEKTTAQSVTSRAEIGMKICSQIPGSVEANLIEHPCEIDNSTRAVIRRAGNAIRFHESQALHLHVPVILCRKGLPAGPIILQ